MTSSCAILGWDPEGVRCKIVNDIHLCHSWACPFFYKKSRFLDSKRGIGHYKLNESMTWPATPGIPKLGQIP